MFASGNANNTRGHQEPGNDTNSQSEKKERAAKMNNMFDKLFLIYLAVIMFIALSECLSLFAKIAVR